MIYPLHTELWCKDIKKYVFLYNNFLSFLDTEVVQVVETFPFSRGQGPICPTWSISWLLISWRCKEPGGCFTNILRLVQNNLAKIYNARNNFFDENFELKLCACAQSTALGTCTKFQLEILIRSTISAIHKFRGNILESSWNISETPPARTSKAMVLVYLEYSSHSTARFYHLCVDSFLKEMQ